MRRLTLPIRDQVDLSCWPESSIGVYSESLSHFRDVEQTRQLSRDSWNSLEPGKDFQRHLLAGGKVYRHDATEHGPYSMTAFLIGPGQDILGRYRKRTLLPFGEYVPGQSFYPAIREWFTIRDVMIAGSDPAPLVTDDGHRLGVLICYEDMLPSNARQTASAGAQVLFSLIQGTAFENPLTLRQHQRLAVMRAVENRRYFVRCASTGVTCVIEPTGRIIAELPVNVEDVLLSDIALVEEPSVYTRLGNGFAWLCTLATAAGLVVCWAGSKKAAKNPPLN
jgi:apolipoprotein N-acyltransferase